MTHPPSRATPSPTGTENARRGAFCFLSPSPIPTIAAPTRCFSFPRATKHTYRRDGGRFRALDHVRHRAREERGGLLRPRRSRSVRWRRSRARVSSPPLHSGRGWLSHHALRSSRSRYVRTACNKRGTRLPRAAWRTVRRLSRSASNARDVQSISPRHRDVCRDVGARTSGQLAPRARMFSVCFPCGVRCRGVSWISGDPSRNHVQDARSDSAWGTNSRFRFLLRTADAKRAYCHLRFLWRFRGTWSRWYVLHSITESGESEVLRRSPKFSTLLEWREKMSLLFCYPNYNSAKSFL